MAAMGLLHWRNTVCRSAGNVIRKPVAISVRRSGAYFLVSTGADAGRQKNWLLRQSLALCHLQIGLMFLLAPLQIALFHGISLTSVVANFIAVPLVTFVVVR